MMKVAWIAFAAAICGSAIARDLTREDFELRVDGKLRDITVFSRSVQPLSIAVLLDRSGSTDAEFADVRNAALTFLKQLLKDYRASIETLTWTCSSFSGDVHALSTVLEGQLPMDWGSPVWSATDRVMRSLISEPGRRVVLLFSDGIDTQGSLPRGVSPVTPVQDKVGPCKYSAPGQMKSASNIVQRSEQEAIAVYTVSVDRQARQPGSARELARIAEQSGGSFLRLGNYGELSAAFESIAEELHLQYLLGFVPETDGRRHEISVRVNRVGATVQARTAYVARGPQLAGARWRTEYYSR